MTKYITTIILSVLVFASPAYASETPWQTIIAGEGSNAGSVSTGIEGTVAAPPTASPDAGTYTSQQTVTLTAPGADTIHYFFNEPRLDEELTCSDPGSLYTSPIMISGTGLLRAIACYGNYTTPVAYFSYTIENEEGGTSGSGSNSGNNSGGGSAGGGTTGGGGATGGGSTGGGGGASGGTGGSSTSTSPADFNNDGNVDIFDFNILISNWGTTSGATPAMGDADGNGTVDIFDFNLLIINWQS